MAKTIAEVLDAVKAASGKTKSLIEYSAQQKARVEELLATQGTISPEVQAGLDEIFDIEDADAKAIDSAINTPPVS